MKSNEKRNENEEYLENQCKFNYFIKISTFKIKINLSE
jgi:hypothetical protein